MTVKSAPMEAWASGRIGAGSSGRGLPKGDGGTAAGGGAPRSRVSLRGTVIRGQDGERHVTAAPQRQAA